MIRRVSKKSLLVKFHELQLRGIDIYATYNGERLILYHTGEFNIQILYAVPIDIYQYRELINFDDKKLEEKITMEMAADIVKKTWKKRLLPPRFSTMLEIVFFGFSFLGLVEFGILITLLALRMLR